MENAQSAAFQRLSDILDTLRKECPWDRKQTMKSLRYLTIEEVHELSEAIVQIENIKLKIENGEVEANSANIQFPILNSQLKKELGDLAMHILFYCKIAEEQGLFTTADVYNTICDKLISRHPFIYDKENYHGENWEQLKLREKDRHGVLDGVPDSLPTLVKAVRMQEKVSGTTDNTAEPTDMTEEEFGQKLFDLIDWGRRHGINADDALSLANCRFKEQHSC
jgi:XTP/dITP diphosphohydrolase